MNCGVQNKKKEYFISNYNRTTKNMWKTMFHVKHKIILKNTTIYCKNNKKKLLIKKRSNLSTF